MIYPDSEVSQDGMVTKTEREVRKAGSDVNSNRKWYQNTRCWSEMGGDVREAGNLRRSHGK